MLSLWRKKPQFPILHRKSLSHYLMYGKDSKLLLHKYLNHDMSVIEHMIHFIDGLRTQTSMFVNAPIGFKLRENTNEELNKLIENIC